MLRSVLAAYLDGLGRETDLHQLLLYLLPEMGYDSVALLHGPREHGRDLIAQKLADGVLSQYTFQAKLGDLRKKDVSNLLPQVFEASTADCPHLFFNGTLTQRIVIVTNGQIDKEAAALLSETEEKLQSLKIIIEPWGREKLLGLFERYAANALMVRNLKDAGNIGGTLTLVGQAAQGKLSLFDMEEYSRRWMAIDNLFVPILEAAVLRDASRQVGALYESFYVNLAATRMLASDLDRKELSPPASRIDFLEEQRRVLLADVTELMVQAEQVLDDNRPLSALLEISAIISGSVVCHRWMEAATLGYLLSTETEARQRFVTIILRLLDQFKAASCPVSDKYAVTVFGVAIVLLLEGERERARGYLVSVALWLFDRYEEPRAGLAGVDASVQDEVNTLLGYSFSGVDVARTSCSLLLTALLDATRLFGDTELYADLVNDSLAVEMYAAAYVIPETIALWDLDSEEVEYIPNLQVQEEAYDAPLPHWIVPKASALPLWLFWAVSLLLRDRWFPFRFLNALNETSGSLPSS